MYVGFDWCDVIYKLRGDNPKLFPFSTFFSIAGFVLPATEVV